MPEYILHTVQKGDTLWGISKKYKVEEHKIVQANPEKIKLQKRGSKYTPVIYVGDVLRIPQDTEETVSYKIEGKASLGMGESTEYQLLDSEGNIPHYPSEKISWQFHVDEGSENWRQLRLAKEKTGQKFTIVFTNQKLKAKKIRIEAYFKGQDSPSKLAEFLMVLDGEDTAEIKKLELLDANRNLIKRKLSYAETLFARAQCTGMEGETLYFSLWEDDAPGAGHSKENEENFIATKQAQVVNGRAEVSFSLIYSTMAPIANRKIPAGQKDEGPYHEYYVTVTRYEATEPEKSSKNVDVNNPDYVPLPPKPQPKKKETPKTRAQAQPKKKEPQVIHKDKVNAPAKPPASAWKEPKIIKVYIRDTQGKVWTRRPKYGEKIRIYIESENMVNRKIKVRIYDKDKFSNDLLHEEDRTINASPNFLTISLTKAMQDKGGDVWYQNIFAEVSLYDTKQTVKSEVIDVDKTDFSLPKPEGINPVTKNAPEQKGEDKEGKCPNCEKDITAEELKQIFPSATDANRKLVADTYNKYMKELNMNTCWNKAHLFAQARVEAGLSLSMKAGESFNYYYEGLSIFGAFQTKEGKEKAKLWGRPSVVPRLPGVSRENQIKIANYAYSPPAKKAKELGNTDPNDGWNYRGRGLIQVTGKEFYKYCNEYTKKNGNDVIANPDLIGEKIELAVLASMIFFKWKRINQIANGNKDVKGKICPKVGKDVIAGGKSNYDEKQKAFDNITSKIFKIDLCKWGKSINEPSPSSSESILEEMKKLVDKHIPYSQLGVRNELSEEGLKNLDCSETVGIYLHKLGVMPIYKAIDTSTMTTQANFRKTIGSDNIDWVKDSDKKDFIPQRGDVFVWRKGATGPGHTGIVYNYDNTTDVVTILEAIGKSGAVSEKDQVKNGGYAKTGCSRTAKYSRLKGALYGHSGWVGYFRPKNYTKKL